MNKINEVTVMISTLFLLLFQSGMPSEHYAQLHIINCDRDSALVPSNSVRNHSLLKKISFASSLFSSISFRVGKGSKLL